MMVTKYNTPHIPSTLPHPHSALVLTPSLSPPRPHSALVLTPSLSPPSPSPLTPSLSPPSLSLSPRPSNPHSALVLHTLTQPSLTLTCPSLLPTLPPHPLSLPRASSLTLLPSLTLSLFLPLPPFSLPPPLPPHLDPNVVALKVGVLQTSASLAVPDRQGAMETEMVSFTASHLESLQLG